MKKFLCLLLIPCLLQAKRVEFRGPIIAPFVKGHFCGGYWFEKNWVETCFNIGAGKEYIIDNIPERVDRLKVTRSFDKTCKIKRNNKKVCRTVHGTFYIKKSNNVLNLTYDNLHVLLDYTVPPKKPNSNYGLPRRYPSQARTRLTTINGADAFA